MNIADDHRHLQDAAKSLVDEAYEAGRRLGFEQGIAKSNEYREAAKQDEADARERRGGAMTEPPNLPPIPMGLDGQVRVADSSSPHGWKWAYLPGRNLA